MKLQSIFTSSAVMSASADSEEYPVPKSSIETLAPMARSIGTIVRSKAQEKLLRGIGAVADWPAKSSTAWKPPSTVARSPIAAMDPTSTSRSTSTAVSTLGPIELTRGFGMAWGVGGWLLFPFLQKIGRAEVERLRQRVVSELKTTFASQYTRVVSLKEVLLPVNIQVYVRRATSEKFLIDPSRD